MKAIPLPFEELRVNGVLNFSSVSDSLPYLHQYHHHSQLEPPQKWNTQKLKNCYVGTEPTSVLDTRRSPSPSPPTSTSTLSSSLGGSNAGGTCSTDTTVAAVAAAAEASVPENPSALEKCGLGMDDWDSVLPDSPGQGPSILGFIMGDVEDPSIGLNKLLQTGASSQQDLDFTTNFGAVDQGFVFEPHTSSPHNLGNDNIDHMSLQGPSFSDFHLHNQNVQSNNNARLCAISNSNHIFPVSLGSGVFHNHQQQQQIIEASDEKPQVFNSQVLMSQNQPQFTQNPAMFMPLTHGPVQEHHLLSPPPAKRFNSGMVGSNYQVKTHFEEPGQEIFARRQQHQPQPQPQPQQVQLFPHHLQQRPTMSMSVSKQKMVNDDRANQQIQQGISDQLFKAVELIDTGNTVLAQGILARLNHQLSPIGKPFQRAAFYFKEALQLLLQMNTSNSSGLSPFSMIFKIAAYKSFSEVSPVLQFANFTCNQALLEALNGFDRIHIIDFDIGYGGQWASLMQELALRNGGAPFLKITAFASTSTHDDFEIGFTQENLKNFANDLNIGFELEVLNLESLNSGSWPLPLNVSENEGIAVNLPIGSFFNHSLSLPLVLRFVKHLSPKIVVSVDRGCNRMDAPFPHRVINALQSYSGLLESMDAVTVNLDTQLKIERYLLQPGIEKIVMSRHCSTERLPPWRSLFLSTGFSPLTFSNFAESQAECLVHRTPVQGFHIEKRQTSLVLCWQQKELVSISAWRC